MPKIAIEVNLKASKLGQGSQLVIFLLLTCTCILHPQENTSLLVLPLALFTLRRWYWDWGPKAPRSLILEDGNWWLRDASDQLHPLPAPIWRSYAWLAFSLPWRPWGLQSWLLWPDSLGRAQHRQLRRLLTS